MTTFVSWIRSYFLLILVACFSVSPSFAETEYTFQKNIMIPMRDGVRLAANLFLPKGGGSYPVILIRSPYGKFDENFGDGKKYASHGYALLIQDCRGKGDSEGIWDPFLYDTQDGYDTQQWIGRQPWCNGEIGTSGGSYVGWTQWASAAEGSPYLKTMVPAVPFTDAYEIMYTGGAYQLALSNGWGTLVSGQKLDAANVDWSKALKYLPLQTWEEQFGFSIFYLKNWIKHNTDDYYWQERSMDDKYRDVTVPILNIGGWYDIFSKATLDQVTQVRRLSKNPQARNHQYCIIGPWGHGVDQTKCGEVEFGEAAKLGIGDMQFKWFEYWLKGKDTGVKDWPAYFLFVMGENKWRSADQWPLKETVFTNYYLHGRGKANTSSGDGGLSMNIPEDEEPVDTFVYDPDNPVPTHGGNNLFGATSGSYDQSEIEKRDDILVYSTDALSQDVEITGPVKLMLYAASTARDTDFTAKLVDVHPDGKAYNVCEGIIRASHRESNQVLQPIEPGQVYRYEIDLWVTSNLFKKGHRIRVEVSSSNFPRFDRNPNSGKEFGTDTEVFKATQTIYHDKTYPSHLVLPVIPRG